MELEHILDLHKCTILYESMRITINRFTYSITDGGLFAPVHMHNDYEFHYIVSGKGHITIENVEFDVQEGDIFITNPYVNHSEVSDESDPMVIYCIECEIEFSNSEKNQIQQFELDTLAKTLDEVHYQPFHDDDDIIQLLENIRKVNHKEKIGYFLLSKSMILLCLIKTIHLAENNIKPVKFYYRKYSNETRASSIKNYIDVNIKNELHINDISKYVFLSEKQINRLFLEKYGKTVSQYISDSRFEISKMLLVTTKDNLEDIAMQSGFSSYQHMYRIFKRKLNMSPNEYRIEFKQ